MIDAKDVDLTSDEIVKIKQRISEPGVSGSIDATGVPVFSAWTEWLSAADPVQPVQPIPNFLVHAGDTVETQIWVTSPTTATVVMQNLSSASQGAPVIVLLIAPAGVQVGGADAEWIVERPLIKSSPTDEFVYSLPFYSPVTFTNAAAWS